MKSSATVSVGDVGIDSTTWRSLVPLTKPTISLLVVVTVVPALLMAGPGLPSLATACWTLLGTFLASASSSVFNHLLDADVDERMARTRARPMPSGRVSPLAAIAFGAGLGLVSLVILYVATTPLAAAVALAANVFYSVIYTLCLKRYTDQNIVIGGAAGAVGPLIGWAALTGELAWPAWVMFAIIFLWTPPHFWALAIKYKNDYAAAGIPMLPVSRGDEAARRQIFLYSLTLIPTVAALYLGHAAGWIYLSLAMATTLWFVAKAWRLYKSGDNAHAMPVFHASCLYLLVIFGALGLDVAVGLFL